MDSNYKNPFMVFLSALIASIALGVGYAYLLQIIEVDLLYIFPLVFGAIIFYAVKAFLPKSITLNTITLIGILPIIIGFAVKDIGTSYLDYTDSVNVMMNEFSTAGETLTPKEAKDILNEYLQEETGYTGIKGSYIYSLQSTSITSHRTSSSGIGGFEAGIFFIVIQTLIALITFYGCARNYLSESRVEGKKVSAHVIGNYKSWKLMQEKLKNKDIIGCKQFLTTVQKANLKKDVTTLFLFEPDPYQENQEHEFLAQLHGQQKSMLKGQKDHKSEFIELSETEFNQLKKILEEHDKNNPEYYQAEA